MRISDWSSDVCSSDLLPRGLATVSGRGTPVRITLFTAVVVGVLAGFIPLADLAALANAGTLTAFIAVALCMLIMRRREPDTPRQRPEERRVGKECVSTWSSRWSPVP